MRSNHEYDDYNDADADHNGIIANLRLDCTYPFSLCFSVSVGHIGIKRTSA